MATLDTEHFDLKLANLPLHNLRFDFNALLALFRSERFRKQFKGHRGKQIPIRTHYFTWDGRREALLSHLLREAIISVECAVSGAVFVEGLERGEGREVRDATINPHSLKGQGTADCVYNKLPSLVEPKWAMKVSDPELWERTRSFYTKVRNPLLHAYEVQGHDPEPTWKCLEFLWEVFQWLNGWHPIERLAAGPIRWHQDPKKLFGEIPDLQDARVEQIVPERELLGDREYLRYLPEDLAVFRIEDVKGMGLASEPLVDFTMEDEQGGHVKLQLSAHAAMKLLGLLAIAHEKRGWEIPDPLL